MADKLQATTVVEPVVDGHPDDEDRGSLSGAPVVGVVCTGASRALAAARSVIDVADAAGYAVRLVHPEPAQWVTVPGDCATTLDAADFQRERWNAVRSLAHALGVTVVRRPLSVFGAVLELVDNSDVRVVVLPQPLVPTALLRVAVRRRSHALGRKAPLVVGWRDDRTARAELSADLAAADHS
jgi:hypothetical protein